MLNLLGFNPPPLCKAASLFCYLKATSTFFMGRIPRWSFVLWAVQGRTRPWEDAGGGFPPGCMRSRRSIFSCSMVVWLLSHPRMLCARTGWWVGCRSGGALGLRRAGCSVGLRRHSRSCRRARRAKKHFSCVGNTWGKLTWEN